MTTPRIGVHYSEYVIILILATAIYYLYTQRAFLEQRILRTLVLSIALTMCAELAFTFYVNLYGISNIVGHVFKLLSFWLIFQSVIKTTLTEPFLAMSRSSTTYDAIPDATIVVDEHGIIRDANRAAYSLLDIQSKGLIGRTSHNLFHRKSISMEECSICQAIVKGHELRSLEEKVNDEGKWFEFSISYIKGASAHNGTVEVIRDITLRKQIENEIQELNVLKKSIIDNLPNILFVKDAKTLAYIEWNKAAEKISGIAKKDTIGKTDYDIWPEEGDSFIIQDKNVINNGALLQIIEETVTTKEQGIRTIRTRKIPIYDKMANVKYLLGISEDITDILKTEEMLRRSQKMDAIGQMSGGIAHDFNNQLGVILGYSDLLEGKNLPGSQAKWIGHVRRAAERCAELTQQLLIFSRNGEVDKKIVNINDILSDMEIIIERTMTPAIDISYHKGEGLWTVEVNEGGCKDSILNLVINARDAMLDGGSLTIETTNLLLNEHNHFLLPNLAQGDYIEIMIKDTGIGMSPEVYAHVFEPFYTTKDVGKGTGLGLSMVYGFVRRYGGDVLLETALGQGATFKLYLPRTTKDSSTSELDLSEEFIYPSGDETILLVDDEETLLIYAENILSSWGYKVHCAQNATEALVHLKNESIDLLFSDIVMPGKINGYELAIEAQKLHPNLKVLITSGFSDNVIGNKKYNQHEFSLITKPYKRQLLAKMIRRLLDS